MFVKICGVTTEEDALLAVAMGADAVGFNFVSGSVRQIAVDHARDVSRRLPPDVLTVGVFRDEAPERVVELCHRADLKAAQLHGHEPPDDASWIRSRAGIVIKVFPAGSPAALEMDRYDVDAVMLDGPVPGSGQVYDWSLVEGIPEDTPLILAGGLTPENVVAAIEHILPWGVDVATGVESSPGHKDPIKVRDFVRAAKSAQSATVVDPFWV